MKERRGARLLYGTIILLGMLLAGAIQCKESRTQYLIKAFESEERAGWQKPGLVVSQMGDLSHKTVTDLGAGSGYFSFRLLPRAQKVIAVDVDDGFLDHLRRRKAELAKKNPTDAERLEIRKSVPADPGLARGETDAVLMVNVYHHLPSEKSERLEYMKRLRSGLAPGGTLYLIDWIKGDRPVGPPSPHGIIPREQVAKELQEAAFRVKERDTLLPYQNFFVATPR